MSGKGGHGPERPLRVLVLGGVEARYHAFEEVTPPLGALLEAAGHEPVCARPAQALTAEALSTFDAIVSITTGGELTELEERALLQAIETPINYRGRPVHFLGLHGASCSFENSEAYFRMLGGRFRGHPPLASFEVSVSREHPMTLGVPDFVIVDERYELELCAPVEVLMTARDASEPNPVPLAWVKHHGMGRVAYLALGHAPEQLGHSAVARTIQNALTWFSTDKTRI